MIAAIVAVDANNGIGFDGELLECIPEDMMRFRELTLNHFVIMGRKTWDALPTKPLSDRGNIVISRHKGPFPWTPRRPYYMDMAGCKAALPLLLELDDVFVIGGGEVYEQLLPDCDTVYMTRIDIPHDNIDTFFPALKPNEWSLVEKSEQYEYNGIPYRFLTYKRV